MRSGGEPVDTGRGERRKASALYLRRSPSPRHHCRHVSTARLRVYHKPPYLSQKLEQKMTRNNKLSGPFLPVPRWVLPYISTDYVSHAVLNHFLQYLHPETQELTTSYQHIATQMGCDRRTVMRSIKRLEEIGLVVKQQRISQSNRNLTNRYYINFNNPGVVSAESLVSPESPGVVSPESLGSVSSDTTSGVSSDTQSRVKNKKEINKKRKNSKIQVDERLV